MFANDVESHLRRLQEVFERLRSVNLKLKPSKCTLLQRRVEFLGYVVSNNGLSADQLKSTQLRRGRCQIKFETSGLFLACVRTIGSSYKVLRTLLHRSMP